MRWQWIEDVPPDLMAKVLSSTGASKGLNASVRVLIERQGNPLTKARYIWLDRNLPVRYRNPDRHGSNARPRIFPAEGIGGGKQQPIWLPLPREVQHCCKSLAIPRPQYGWALKRHCCSARHIALMCDVEVEDLMREIRKLIPRDSFQGRCYCGKFLAAGKQYCSIHEFVENAVKEWATAS